MTDLEQDTSTSPSGEVVVHTAAPVAAVDRSATTVSDPYASRRQTASRVVQAIYLVFGVIEALILIRFVLKALEANPTAGFAQFIYAVTAPLVAPFAGLFGNPQASGSTLEVHSVVALIVYALVAWLLARLARLLLDDTRSAVRTSSTLVETKS